MDQGRSVRTKGREAHFTRSRMELVLVHLKDREENYKVTRD